MRRSLFFLVLLALIAASCGGDDTDETEAPATSPGGDALPHPIVFVPGVAGSQINSADQEHWAAVGAQVLSLSDDFLDALALPDDGVPADETTHGDILRTESIEIAGIKVKEADFYATIIRRFEDAGHLENEMLFVFPYDWRIDVNTEAERLRAFIDEVLDDTGADKVDIVAHSMGGLVTLDALQSEEMDGKIGKLVTLGTPVLGATKALGVLEYKAVCFTEEILDRHCITNPSTAQRVMRNFPTSYQLLPSRDFQAAVGSPLEIKGIDVSYDEWAGIVRANRNGTLLDKASSWQTQLAVRPHDPDVEMLRVVGSDRATPVQIERFTINDCYFFEADFCPEKLVTKVIPGPGDGTVPRASAGLHDAERGFDERGGIENHYVDGVNHMALAQDRDVFDVMLAFLLGETEARIASRSDLGAATQSIEAEAEPFDGTAITIIGPAWGTITDGEAVTGPVSEAEADIIYEGIAGSSLWRGGNSQTFVFSDGGSYRGEFAILPPESAEYRFLEQQAEPEALVTDVVLIEVERYRDDELDDSAIYRLDPAADLRFSFDLAVGGDPDDVVVRIDRDGDGEFEAQARKVPDRLPLPDDRRPTPTELPTATPATRPAATATPLPLVRQLLRIGPNDEIAPDLIESWEISDGGSEIFLMLEPGVRLVNGEEFTVKQLVKVIESNREKFIQYEYLGSEPVDDYTLFIALGTSAAEEFLTVIGSIQVAVAPG